MFVFMHMYVVIIFASLWHQSKENKARKFRCPETINIAWVETPPYIYTNKYNVTSGLMVDIFNKGLKSKLGGCCANNVSVLFSPPYHDFEELVDHSLDVEYDAVMPMVSELGTERYLAFPFVLLESPGSALLNYRRQATSTNVLNTFVTVLPLVLILILYVCIFGVLFWIVETIPKKNGENRPFLEMLGEIWEGVWWAFVTLATVGYGDVVPSKFASRVVTYIWMLLSSIFVAFFTASVTSTLTSECFSVDLKIPGTEIAVINGSREHKTVLKRSGVPAVFSNYTDYFQRAMLDENIKGALVELYAASFYSEKFKHLRIQDVYEDVTAYGVVLHTRLINIEGCLKQFVLSSQREIYHKIKKKLPPLKTDVEASAAEENSMGILTLTISKLQTTLITMSGLLVMLSILGILRERFFLKPNTKDENMRQSIENEVECFQNILAVTFTDMINDVNQMQHNLNDIMEQANERTKKDTTI